MKGQPPGIRERGYAPSRERLRQPARCGQKIAHFALFSWSACVGQHRCGVLSKVIGLSSVLGRVCNLLLTSIAGPCGRSARRTVSCAQQGDGRQRQWHRCQELWRESLHVNGAAMRSS